ncbi:MAG: hypothetical protein ACU84H_03110 [Gammaproteobacteria bacterium]
MPFRFFSLLTIIAMIAAVVSGCASTRQIAIDHPQKQTQPFHPLNGFQAIDGDDYYVRLISEFDYQHNGRLKSGCADMAPSYEKTDTSAALIFRVRNDVLKYQGEATGFLYQAATGKCNFTFDAKKMFLTPWIRLDNSKETAIDYHFYTNANSDLDISALVNEVNAASSLLALTGVGMGVAIMGQVAGQWADHNQKTQTSPTRPSMKQSSESYSLPAFTAYSGQSGMLNQTVFKVYEVSEGGFNLWGSEAELLGELKIHPQIQTSLLLKSSADGIPDARDLSLDELGNAPIKSASGDINLRQLLEQSHPPTRPSLNPDWTNYGDVEANCRKLKLIMKELGFNKFDRNALLYYFLAKSDDWKNYNFSREKALNDEIRPKIIKKYRDRNFGNCLAQDDYAVMKAMGLPVNTAADWNQIGETRDKKEQFFTPLKSIERQLRAVLTSTNATEMERQLYPLIATATNGDGSVLLQNHLGDFGLEKLLSAAGASTPVTAAANTPSAPGKAAEEPEPLPTATPMIPGQGITISARQLAQVFNALAIHELSCARPIPVHQGKRIGNIGVLLFTTRENSPRAKGGAMEFEFAGGKINRIAFQLPTYRDFEQDILDNPDLGGCRIDPSILSQLH